MTSNERGGGRPARRAGRPAVHGDAAGRWRALAAALVALLVLVTACTAHGGGRDDPPVSAPPSAVSPALTQAAPDPYFPDHGDTRYDVSQYDVAVTYDPASKELSGTVTITATAVVTTESFSLDFADLTVEEVTVDGRPATVEHTDGKLHVSPAQDGITAGTTFTTEITYAGTPEPFGSSPLGGVGFHPTSDGAFAVGEPQSASSWMPVNEHPRDKARYRFEVTVPEGLVAVSNGVPEGRETRDGWTTWRWVEPDPMASYLALLVIGEYRLHETEHRGAPMVIAVHEDLPTSVDDVLMRTGEIADTLAEWFGPYPFEAYGGVALADERVGFALETQSRPVYGPGFFRADGSDATRVIAHELAHQWFGDSVSVREWDDIWLNEGFATYAEWLWSEHSGGLTAQEAFDERWEYLQRVTAFWATPPADPGPANLFSTAVYERGAIVLHALRLTVGDDTFFRILRTWTAEKRNGNASTEEFIVHCEKVAGRSLDAFFDEWLYGTERPTYPR